MSLHERLGYVALKRINKAPPPSEKSHFLIILLAQDRGGVVEQGNKKREGLRLCQ
jgi:hypothetical protein